MFYTQIKDKGIVRHTHKQAQAEQVMHNLHWRESTFPQPWLVCDQQHL